MGELKFFVSIFQKLDQINIQNRGKWQPSKIVRFFLNKDTLHFNLAYLVGFVFQVEKKELKLLDIVNDKVLFTKRMDYI